MSAEVKVEGMQELIDKIQELGKQSSKIQNQILLKAAQPILADAVETTTFTDRTGKLRRKLKVGRPKTKGDTKYVLIGIDKSDMSEVFYGKMHEFGTSHFPARPFMGPAYERHKGESLDIIKSELRQALGL